MRKIVIITICWFLTKGLLAQRYVDGKVELIEPSPYDTMFSPSLYKVSFLYTNQGPDSLYPDDTMNWRIHCQLAKYDLPTVYIPVGRYLAPSEYMIVYDTFSIDFYEERDDVLFTFTKAPSCYGLQTDRPRLFSEFYDDRQKDNNPSIRLFHRFKETTSVPESLPIRVSDVIVYPNPSAAGVINIQGEFDLIPVQIELINSLGQIDVFETKKVSENHFKIDLIGLKTGVYWIRFWDCDVIYRRSILLH